MHRWAFSEFWAGMTNGHYQSLPASEQGLPEAEKLLAEYSAQPRLWSECTAAWDDAQAWYAGAPMSFTPGPAFAGLTKRTVLYYNPKIVHPAPAWAIPAKQDAGIFDETFYHDR